MSAPETPPVVSQLPQSVRFSFSLFELIKCRLWVINHHKFLLGLTLGFSLLFPLVDLFDPKLGSNPIGAKIFVFIFSAVAMFCFLTFVNAVFQIIFACSAKNRGLVGNHELTISDDCLTESTEFNDSSHRWSGFDKLRSSRNFFFLYVTENNVIYVPKKCFASVQEAKQFEELIQRKIGKV